MKKALIVGINDYPKNPLNCCKSDAQEIHAMLKENSDQSPNFDSKLCLDIRAKIELYTSISELFKGDCDTALFYFSGHGYMSERGGYIVTPDSMEYSEGVRMDDILNLANESKIKDKIIILDCCYSGAMGNHCDSSDSSTLKDGVTILTSSRRDEVSVEANGHGIFTELLVQALEGGAANLHGEISPGSVYAYIDQALGPWDQRPVFKTNVSRFTSLRKVVPKVSSTLMREIVKYFPSPESEHSLNPSYEFTNSPDYEHRLIEPNAIKENVDILKKLQLFESVGLVEPVGEEHMYFAAMNSKSCKLTALGKHYWRLINNNKF